MEWKLSRLLLAIITLTIFAGCSSSTTPPADPVAGAGTASAVPASTSGADPQYMALALQSVEEVKQKTADFEGLFQIGTADWELDQDTGLITFKSKSGVVATAPVQLAGTYSQADGTWLWAWENPSIDAKLAAHATRAREHGQQHNVADLTTAKLALPEDKALELAAVTCKLGGHQGVYRGASEGTVLFITFGEPTVQQGPPAGAGQPAGSAADQAGGPNPPNQPLEPGSPSPQQPESSNPLR
jgi:hypothetical protein